MRNLGKLFITLGSVIALLAAAFGIFVYSMSGNPSDTNPLSFNGPWSAQVNSTSFMTTITGDDIEIQWVEGDDTSGLYWKGTFPVPASMTQGSEFDIKSTGDVSAMSASLFGSQDDQKTFTYKNGKLNFKMTVAGVTTIVHLERQELGV